MHPERDIMKSMVRLSLLLLKEVGEMAGINTSRDREEIVTRSSKEGLSFLTITLPLFEKSLMAALERGYITPDDFPGWGRASGTPKFLGDFLGRIFADDGFSMLEHPGTPRVGSLSAGLSDQGEGEDPSEVFEQVSWYVNHTSQLSIPDSEMTPLEGYIWRETTRRAIFAIQAVRQITLLHSKVEMECKPCRMEAALRSYKETDNEVEEIPKERLAGLPVVPRGSTVHTCEKYISS